MLLAKIGFSDDAVRGKIVDHLKSTAILTYEQACERRQRLMDERRTIFEGDNSDFFETPRGKLDMIWPILL